MRLLQRIDLMARLGEYMLSDNKNWLDTCNRAHQQNAWFTSEHIYKAIHAIGNNFLQSSVLKEWVSIYSIPEINKHTYSVGIIMAGNIPLVGFYDFLCVFITGHKAVIKLSSKDNILLKHLIEKLYEWDDETQKFIQISEFLKGCDAYITTGSNNSSRYFEYYFAKYPHIIRRNRTSIGVLTGNETKKELEGLADDICLYFGLGCRNVTHVFIPLNYEFINLLEALKKYNYFMDFHKYKNNYDYQLALHLLNNTSYMSNDSIILIEHESIFSPISQLNYSYYQNENELINNLPMQDLQCIIGHNFTPFGKAQHPNITDYADGVDTINFLLSLNL